MPRPVKCRMVEREPVHTVFKPAGVPKTLLEEEVVTVEGLEAIRLKDLLGLEQEECAECMHVSRATFQRLLTSARESIARALIEGKALRIEGGNYRVRRCCGARDEIAAKNPRCRRECYQDQGQPEDLV